MFLMPGGSSSAEQTLGKWTLTVFERVGAVKVSAIFRLIVSNQV
jgi:hypothetical protein